MEVITLSQEPNLNWIKLLELPFPSLRTHAKEVIGQMPTKMTNREADHFGKMHVETYKDMTTQYLGLTPAFYYLKIIGKFTYKVSPLTDWKVNSHLTERGGRIF